MDQGHKHFSHLHNLAMHQMPEGVEVSCSGCHSSATGSVYVCWQCNFFLHDQCFKATRSLKHPSHPPHPLTLVPYPTYHSNSFYCNSCQISGTGFSYSCADCEFDLHVQCAYSISLAASFKNANLFQELVPAGCNAVPDSVPESHPIPFAGPSNHYTPPNSVSGVQHHSMSQISTTTAQVQSLAHNLASVSISSSYPFNLIPSAQDPSQNIHSVSIPTSSHIPSVQYPSVGQNGPSVSIPTNYPPNPIPSTQDPSVTQKEHFYIPSSSQYPSMAQTGPSVSIPTSSHNSSAQYPSMAQTGPSVSIQTKPSNPNISTHEQDPSKPENGFKDKDNIKHFSHPHKLCRVSLQEDEEKEVICSGCEETIVGKGYSCVEPDCSFHLHESCFHLKQQIHHKSHPKHPLTLLPNGGFTCSACFSDGTGFTYHCSVCEFDLHIQCVSLPETVKRCDHKHMLKLFYSCPVEDEDYTFSCDVCHGEVQKDRWVYYCESCDYGTHLGCVDCEECERDGMLDPQAQLQMLQMQMEMARQRAQLIMSMGSSLASLAG